MHLWFDIVVVTVAVVALFPVFIVEINTFIADIFIADIFITYIFHFPRLVCGIEVFFRTIIV